AAVGADDAALARRVHALLEPHAEEAAAVFADRLRMTAPALHDRLMLGEPAARRRLLAAVGLAVRGLDRVDELVAALARLGVRAGAATPQECRHALEAATWTLQRGLGDRLTPEMRRAWEAAGRAVLRAAVLRG
ncbi:MAG: hypothetical protein AB1416_04060, partial [Actinomycetota bacterium]